MKKMKYELIDITEHRSIGHAADREICTLITKLYLDEHIESEVFAYCWDDEMQLYTRDGGFYPQI